jgi:ribosomal protein S18 acetylase RimI-like enzyme
MEIARATLTDLDTAVACLVDAFSQDPITGYLLEPGPLYNRRLAHFFSLLMRARIALEMPVLVARDSASIRGAAMGYATIHPEWPNELSVEWDRFERSIPGISDRMANYDEIASRGKPLVPHYYLGVIGVAKHLHGSGIGMRLIRSFCDLSASDPSSHGVYLETANESNLRFYERAGFSETGRGKLGSAMLWCMYLPHRRHDA